MSSTGEKDRWRGLAGELRALELGQRRSGKLDGYSKLFGELGVDLGCFHL